MTKVEQFVQLVSWLITSLFFFGLFSNNFFKSGDRRRHSSAKLGDGAETLRLSMISSSLDSDVESLELFEEMTGEKHPHLDPLVV